MAKKVLLHSCCAPCSSAILEWMLAHDCEPVIFYSNSNIYPDKEYDIRSTEILHYAEKLGVEIIYDNYDHEDWHTWLKQGGEEANFDVVKEPERGKRCLLCFRYRLLRAARKAKELGIECFTTTLASSRWKSLEQINEAGKWAAEQVGGVAYWDQNWRKGGLQDRRNQLLKENNFYNQLYCGCEYSMARLNTNDSMEQNDNKHWVSCWGNATSISDRKEAVYAKDLTLRYPIFMPFDGTALRLRFSNLTGTEAVTIDKVVIDGRVVASLVLEPGEEKETEPIDIQVVAGSTIEVSLYMSGYTQLNAGTLITGPLSRGYYAYGDYSEAKELPADLSRKTNWFYFLNTVDILSDKSNYALVCYGDSITAQSWPDYLQLRAWEQGYKHVAIIRRAVSGTRILRQYDCITYQAYGLKGATRFPIEMKVSGAKAVIIQHGINDIIHPVGVEVNSFRPWSDMPTVEDLISGYEHIYLAHARALNLKIYTGTLLPIFGWRTYNEERDAFRNAFNQYLRTSEYYDGCVDFDKAVADGSDAKRFAPGFDSGDHLHPSESAYRAMAEAVPSALLNM